MKILVIGSGGREHAIALKLSQSPKATKIYCAPGNAGTSQIAENLNINADDISALKEFALNSKIDLTVVGPELPLVAGIVDEFEAASLKIFGPNKAAAQLEGSKVFAKKIMMQNQIPTAEAVSYTNPNAAIAFVKQIGVPVVIKADGLAAGKGVIIAKTFKEAEEAVNRIMVKKEFGPSGDQVLVEDNLIGEEVSILALTDGETILPLATSQDHKRIFDNDKGPNTGGMGAYSPAPIVTPDLFAKIKKNILEKTIKALKAEGIVYKGLLYCGLMIAKNSPYVLEYNCRFGDPETQVILPRMKSDLLEALLAVVESRLSEIKIEWDPRSAVCVVLASGGYPGSYEKGKEIYGLLEAMALPDSQIFHAGTKIDDDRILSSGGRVLNAVGLGKNLKEAMQHTYELVKMIKFENMHYRKDIGTKGLKVKIGG